MGAGLLGLIGSMGNRYAFRQPMNARIHGTAFSVVSMFWLGYQYHKWRCQLEMGDFKYAVDFAERHSVSFIVFVIILSQETISIRA